MRSCKNNSCHKRTYVLKYVYIFMPLGALWRWLKSMKTQRKPFLIKISLAIVTQSYFCYSLMYMFNCLLFHYGIKVSHKKLFCTKSTGMVIHSMYFTLFNVQLYSVLLQITFFYAVDASFVVCHFFTHSVIISYRIISILCLQCTLVICYIRSTTEIFL